MTREEAIRIIKIVLAVAEDFEITVQGEEFTEEKCKEAVDMAVKALEQEPILDKIRAEIVHLHDWAFSREGILRIIDKYKASPTGAERSE